MLWSMSDGSFTSFFFFFFWDIPIGRKPWLRAFTKSWARPHFKMDYSSPPQKRLVILKAFMLPKKTNKKTDCIFQKKKKKKGWKGVMMFWCDGFIWTWWMSLNEDLWVKGGWCVFGVLEVRLKIRQGDVNVRSDDGDRDLNPSWPWITSLRPSNQ